MEVADWSRTEQKSCVLGSTVGLPLQQTCISSVACTPWYCSSLNCSTRCSQLCSTCLTTAASHTLTFANTMWISTHIPMLFITSMYNLLECMFLFRLVSSHFNSPLRCSWVMSKQGIVKFIHLVDNSTQVPKVQKKNYTNYRLMSSKWTKLDLLCQVLRVLTFYGLALPIANPPMQHPALAQQQFSSKHIPTISCVFPKGGQGLQCLTWRRGGRQQKVLKKTTNFDAHGRHPQSWKGGATSKGFCMEKRTEIGLYYRMYSSLQ